jgi:hypothetical protein
MECHDLSAYSVEEIPNPETPELSIYNESSQNPISSVIHSIPLSAFSGTHERRLSPYGSRKLGRSLAWTLRRCIPKTTSTRGDVGHEYCADELE